MAEAFTSLGKLFWWSLSCGFFFKRNLDSVKIINDRLKLVSEKYLLKCEAQIRQNRLRQVFAIEKVQIESYGKVTDC